MLRGILHFEWRYHTRQAVFFASLAIFAGMSFALVGTGYGAGENVHLNSPHGVAQSLGLLSLTSLFVLGIFCAATVQRDAEHGMTELLYTTSVTQRDYLLGRFLGALLATLAVFAVATLALMVAPYLMAVPPEQVAPPSVGRYLWALLVVVTPNVVFAASLLFAISALSRSRLASYVGGVFVYALYLVGSMWAESPIMAGTAPQTAESLSRAALLDPFGLSALFELSRYWTEAERNTRLVPLEGNFLWNRLLWLSVAVAVLGFVHGRFSFRASAVKPGKETRSEAPVAQGRGAAYRPVEVGTPRGRRAWEVFVSAARLELRHVLRSWPFLALLALWVFVVAMEIVTGAGRGEAGTYRIPTTGRVLESVWMPLSQVGTLVVIYFGAELAWRERMVRFESLLDATPASSFVFFASKLAALVALVGVMTAVPVALGLAFQLMRGQVALEPGLYLSLFYFGGLPLVLFAVAVLFIQTLSPHRYVGMVLSLLLALVASHGASLGLEHPMTRFGATPRVSHSDLDGFGPMAASFTAFMVYWSAFAGLLALVTWGLWRRGLGARWSARLRGVPGQWGRAGRFAAVAFGGVFVLAGGFIIRDTWGLGTYQSRDTALAWRERYERTYKVLEPLPLPSLVAVTSRVDLFPEARRYRATGTYRLENRTHNPLDTLWVALPRTAGPVSLSLKGAEQVAHDEDFGMFHFRLQPPLPPGGVSELSFDVTREERGVRATGFELSLVENGSFILNEEVFPTLGYRRSHELGDPAERRARGLPEQPRMPLLDESRKTPVVQAPVWHTLDLMVSTSSDQTVVAPGRLRKQWSEEGRSYFHYVVDRPMTPVFAIVSARYAVERTRHQGVDVEVYYHPAHAYNVKAMLEATTRSLDDFGARFHRYPDEQLRIVEIPKSWSFGALAMRQVIYFVEDRGFLTDMKHSDAVDLVTRRTAHEVAHQWWGHMLAPATVEGATMLVESLTKYSEQRVLAGLHGEHSLVRELAFDRDRYLAGRAGEAAHEPGLYRGTGQSYLYYGKGALVMNALRDLLGEAKLDAALRRLLVSAGREGSVTTLDLLTQLHLEASPGQHVLIDEWLKDVVLYDLKVESSSVEVLPDGRFQVTARMSTSKRAVRGGEDILLPMDESLDVAVYTDSPRDGVVEDSLLHVQRHRFQGPSTEVSFIVEKRPTHVGIDPFILRIERERSDNFQKLSPRVSASAAR
ncbi:ABC transporter permease/M1 family aminopeptidase [Myxococcus stipitatus]|uniref:ABC transporter permease/M1 family aminopeptidase n=1 Tax=Myxococcus stipitatus TaxID=83455 RepID=UPI0030D0C234